MRLAVLAVVLAACGDDPSSQQYDCQPICQYENGAVLGSSKMDYVITTTSEDDADDTCMAQAASDGDRCDTGGTVVRCSCEALIQTPD